MAVITISGTSLSNWQGSSSGIELRIYTNSYFTGVGGTPHMRTVLTPTRYGWIPSPAGTAFMRLPCTVSAGTITIPDATLNSTTDSPDNPEATYSAVFWDTTANLPLQTFGTKPAFFLEPTPTSTTWQDIWAAQNIAQ